MAKEKRASWFKLFLHQKPMMDAVPDDVLGRAIKGAMAYFESGDVAPMDAMEQLLFLMLKPYIDEAEADYQKKAENGKKGGRPKKQTKPEVFSETQSKANETEADAEADAEAEAEADADAEKESVCILADKPPAPARFIPPKTEQIIRYCKEKGYCVDPQRFVDYYTSIGWRVGKSPMRDWKAAVRNWNRKENPNGKTEAKPAWTVGTQL